MEWEFTTCISGRYKWYKREVDKVREEFNDNGIKVLQPPPGPLELTRVDGFTPIKPEIHLPISVVEDNFLRCIRHSDFLYIVNPDGTIGVSISLELGFAAGIGLPVFSTSSVHNNRDEEHEGRIYSQLKVATVTEVLKIMRKYREEQEQEKLSPRPKLFRILSHWDGPILPYDPNKPPIFLK